MSKLLIPVWIILSAAALQAQDLRDPRFMKRANVAFDDIFNMDYGKAEQVFTALAGDYPHHPGPPLYIASIHWLKEMLRRQDLSLDRFIAPGYFTEKTKHTMPEKERAEFFKNLQRAESLSNAILRENRGDKDGRYFLATAYGLRSSFAITVDHKLREAFSYGNKAYAYMKQLTREDPQYYDAYLTVGIYEYVVGSIPWYMRWMAYVIGARGTKQDGIAFLKLAAEKGPYVKDQAQLVLMVLDVREHRYSEALELARSLSERFPRSFLFPINHAQALKLAGLKEESAALLLQIEKRVEAREPNYDKIPPREFRFSLATELLYMGKLDPARERFQKLIADLQTPPEEQALSHLRLCRILDWKGERDEAIRQCRQVLSLEDFDNSHRQAEQTLRRLKGR
jgi:tetratricopeptide (TPR) repeat protein